MEEAGGGMTEYLCWFCGKNVDRDDALAVVVAARNLWSSDDDDPTQYLFIHSLCASDRLAGADTAFEPSDLLDPG
jgi:hypothetical protein